jgi:hypothetical protein
MIDQTHELYHFKLFFNAIDYGWIKLVTYAIFSFLLCQCNFMPL